jgi:portal protein
MRVAKEYNDKLESLKMKVRDYVDYWKQNNNRYNEFMSFVFESSLNDDDRNLLSTLGKPDIEFNIMEAFLSKQMGEFAKHEPEIEVLPSGTKKISPDLLEFLEGHLRHIIDENAQDGTQYNLFKEIMGGGFSFATVYTDYANEESFEQVISYKKERDPTLCGFDPMAETTTKRDASYFFKAYPMSKEDAEERWPDIDLKGIDFVREVAGLSWSYTTKQINYLVVCEFYEIKKKKKRIVRLADKQEMTMEEYEDFLVEWQESGKIEQPPVIIAKRWTHFSTVCRYVFIENQVLEYRETDFECMPMVFFDGNSVMLKKSEEGTVKQMTRPYLYHLKGSQRLKNFAGQTQAAEIENLVQHKFKVSKESIPNEPNYIQAYTNVQQASVLVYNEFSEKNPDVRLTPPTEVGRIQTPPEVIQTFLTMDTLMQTQLGTQDMGIGPHDRDLSGRAMMIAAMNSNAAAMPMMVNYLQGLTQLGNIIVKMIPKYITTPRTLPVLGKDGRRGYVEVNAENGQGIQLNYDSNHLQVKVSAGVNFAIQKANALREIIGLMQASPGFAQFINEDGLEVLVDNLEIHGADRLKDMAPKYMQKLQQRMQQQMQQAQQTNPAVLKAQVDREALQQKAQQNQLEAQVKMAQVEAEKDKIDLERIRILSDIDIAQLDAAMKMEKYDAEEGRTQADIVIKAMEREKEFTLKSLDMAHQHAKNLHESRQQGMTNNV